LRGSRRLLLDSEGLHGVGEGEPTLSKLDLHALLLPVLLLLLLLPTLLKGAGEGGGVQNGNLVKNFFLVIFLLYSTD